MRNEGNVWIWVWIIILFIIIPTIIMNSITRNSMLRDSLYDITGEVISDNYHEKEKQYEQEMYEETLREQQYEDYYQQELEEELQREIYEDELRRQLYEEELREQERRDQYTEKLRRQQYEDYYQEEYQSTTQTTTLTVSTVIDGDTIKLSTGETVRLIGINAPEVGQPCSSEATNKLKEFVLGKQVTLEKDIDDKDQYGRLLRYVYVSNGIFVNSGMVWLGFAHKYEYGSNTKYSSLFEQAENGAKENGGCLWKSEEMDYIQDQCFVITNFRFNAAGNDNYNLNDEYVTLKNTCDYYVDINGWTIKDETASHIYYFPDFIINSGNSFTLYTGIGTNTNSRLYWGRQEENYAAIWNNNGDTLFLRDNQGNLVLSKSYSGY